MKLTPDVEFHSLVSQVWQRQRGTDRRMQLRGLSPHRFRHVQPQRNLHSLCHEWLFWWPVPHRLQVP